VRTAHRSALLVHRIVAVIAVAIGLLAVALTYAGPSFAHATRVASDPTENAELAQTPARVSATFNEAMQAQFAAMTVIGPDSAQWSQGQPSVDGAVISIGVREGGPAGVYTVNYRATSADGHVVSGKWSYRVTAAGPGTASSVPAQSPVVTPPPATADAGSDGLPVWPFAVGATVVVALGAVWAVRRRA
jgi:methionine-rich copper-binding protein CopC